MRYRTGLSVAATSGEQQDRKEKDPERVVAEESVRGMSKQVQDEDAARVEAWVRAAGSSRWDRSRRKTKYGR